MDRQSVTISAEAAARYFVHLASHAKEPVPLTQVHLHKLLYYAQGWSLATRGRVLFPDRIEAWVHGPVTPSVRPIFKRYADGAVDPSEGREAIPLEDRVFLASVWAMNRRHSAYELRRRTHAEPPWKDAREGLAPDTPSNREITVAAMLAHFGAERARQLRLRGISARALDESLTQARRGEVVDVDLASRMPRGS